MVLWRGRGQPTPCEDIPLLPHSTCPPVSQLLTCMVLWRGRGQPTPCEDIPLLPHSTPLTCPPVLQPLTYMGLWRGSATNNGWGHPSPPPTHHNHWRAQVCGGVACNQWLVRTSLFSPTHSPVAQSLGMGNQHHLRTSLSSPIPPPCITTTDLHGLVEG